MSLFKLDSKIYGAWTVDKEDELSPNGNTHKIIESQHDQQSDNLSEVGDNSNNGETKSYVKKILTLKF